MSTVLIVDDTAVDRRLAGGLLARNPNIEICYAENGKRSPTALRASSQKPNWPTACSKP